MMQARWQYKKKDPAKIRAIFNGKNDPAVKEMEVAAKCVGLIRRSVGTNDFSMSSGLELGEWLEKAEDDLNNALGRGTELRIVSTDFKNFFPSNKKSEMVGVVQAAIDMIFQGKTSVGTKMPNNKWITIPKGKKEKAVWGKRSVAGAQFRRVADVVQYLKFRAEIASAFRVGNVILQGEEVIIGEKISPAICDLKAMLDEDKLMSELTRGQRMITRCRRYVDDGIRVIAVDGTPDRRGQKSIIRADNVGKQMAVAYSGIEVTNEGEATKEGGDLLFLEYKIGVSEDGKSVRWHHWNKNIECVIENGVQKFLKLKHWRSGTFKSKLLSVLRSRMDGIAVMTRRRLNAVGERGLGDLNKDVA
jgi:hypothetical protein